MSTLTTLALLSCSGGAIIKIALDRFWEKSWESFDKAGKFKLSQATRRQQAMRFGLICFLALFLGTEFVQWVAQFSWLGGVEPSLPLALLGGGGLAIASNYKPFIQPFPPISAPSSPPELEVSSKAPEQPSPPSISFKINKPNPSKSPFNQTN